MNPVQEAVFAFLPRRHRSTPSGWTVMNAPCCINRGHTKDTKKRGGFRFDNQGFVYHCFNCGFKAGWSPGKTLSINSKNLLSWLGASEEELTKLLFYTLKNKELIEQDHVKIYKELEEKQLPPQTQTIEAWAEQGENSEDFLKILEYIDFRGLKYNWYNWHWSAEPGFRDRLIIPFYENSKIVGWTGRRVFSDTMKYLTHSQPGIVFNIDSQKDNREYCIVVEGQLDAIAIDGLAIMTNEINQRQIAKINNLGKTVIVVPDQDPSGAELLKYARDNQWAVSCPLWYNCKDVSDAVKKYGRLYTLYSIIKNIETNSVKIQLLEKKLKLKTN